MWRICRGEPRNLAKRPAESGEICRRKMWSLKVSLEQLQCCDYLFRVRVGLGLTLTLTVGVHDVSVDCLWNVSAFV